jgi:KEOPS complex subunit Cgi121
VLMEIFNITEEEIKSVGDDKIPELVLERVALVDVIK